MKIKLDQLVSLLTTSYQFSKGYWHIVELIHIINNDNDIRSYDILTCLIKIKSYTETYWTPMNQFTLYWNYIPASIVPTYVFHIQFINLCNIQSLLYSWTTYLQTCIHVKSYKALIKK